MLSGVAANRSEPFGFAFSAQKRSLERNGSGLWRPLTENAEFPSALIGIAWLVWRSVFSVIRSARLKYISRKSRLPALTCFIMINLAGFVPIIPSRAHLPGLLAPGKWTGTDNLSLHPKIHTTERRADRLSYKFFPFARFNQRSPAARFNSTALNGNE